MTTTPPVESSPGFAEGRIDVWVKHAPDADPLPQPLYVYLCDRCWTLVPTKRRQKHEGWHREMSVQR